MRQQFLMRPHLSDLTFVHHDDLVGSLDGRQAVCDDQRGSSFYHAAESIAYFELGFRIDAGRRLIEDQNLRLMRQCARERDELFLPSRKC